jgi:hypothetical protein
MLIKPLTKDLEATGAAAICLLYHTTITRANLGNYDSLHDYYHRQTNRVFGQLLSATRRVPSLNRRGDCEGEGSSIRVEG